MPIVPSICTNSPIEGYPLQDKGILVKREDLCISKTHRKDAPPFAKIRGLFDFILNKQRHGFTHFGYMDTAISMAGWAISYTCNILNVQSVLFYPEYKDGYRYNQNEYIPKWEKYGAEIYPLAQPTQRQINIHRAKRKFLELHPSGFWLPDGLSMEETKINIMQECQTLPKNIKTLVVCVGSGTMLAGILKGLSGHNNFIHTIIGVTVNNTVEPLVLRKKVLQMADMAENQIGFFPLKKDINAICRVFQIVSSGFAYHEICNTSTPFPCNHYYDRKAWGWLSNNIKNLQGPVLFWNIGEGTNHIQ